MRKANLIKLVFLILFTVLVYYTTTNKNKKDKRIYFKKNGLNISQIYEIERIIQDYPCLFTNFKQATNLCEYQSMFRPIIGIFDEKFMPKESLDTARLYINTVKYSVLNLFYLYFDSLLDGSARLLEGSRQAYTISDLRRLDSVQMILEDLILRNVKGDFIELGVWKGDNCILAKAIFHAYKQNDRKIFLVGSFDSLQFVELKYPVDKLSKISDDNKLHKANITKLVKMLKKKMNLYFKVEPFRDRITKELLNSDYLLDKSELKQEFQVETKYIVGYLKDVLPKAIKNKIFKCFSLLKLEGGLYKSTWKLLEHLYPYLNEGGIVFIDDFFDWIDTFSAVIDFRKIYKIDTPIIQVYHGAGETVRGAFFRKPNGAFVKSCK